MYQILSQSVRFCRLYIKSVFFGSQCTYSQRLIKHAPPSVANKGTKWACSLQRMLTNLLKSATLLRVRISSNLSLRSRSCPMFIRCSLCGHVIHPTVASLVTNASSVAIRFSSWTPLIDSVRIRFLSKGRTSWNSTPTSTKSFLLCHITCDSKNDNRESLLLSYLFIWFACSFESFKSASTECRFRTVHKKTIYYSFHN